MERALQRGYVSLLLDGQQRISSLYGLIRGTPPPFFDGNPRAFADLRFHPGREEFRFYAPVPMRDDPLWLDVSAVMREGPVSATGNLGTVLEVERYKVYLERAMKLYAIRDRELHHEAVTGDKTIDEVVELFNRVNTGGTKLSKGDLALAKLCASWPEARDQLKLRLAKWKQAGYDFRLDWLLRNVNAVLTGRAELEELSRVSPDEFRQGLVDTERAVDAVLNLASSRLGLDHDRVFGGVATVPVMTRFIHDRGGRLPDAATGDRLLFWYVNAFLWRRYAGSTETVLNTDLQLVNPALRGSQARSEQAAGDPLDLLIGELRRQRGDLRVTAGDLLGRSKGARFYPLLYMLSRVGGARDLRSGLELRRHLLGQHASLEIHHVFPKALLIRHEFGRPERNALANFAFLTLETNRTLADRPPHEYLAECEAAQPGVLASQWIPSDPALWHVARYPEFLLHRRELIAAAANRLLDELRGGGAGPQEERVAPTGQPVTIRAGEEEEDREIEGVQGWMYEQGLPRGIRDLALLALDGASEDAVLDVAWPDGLIQGEKVALLLNEPPEILEAAGRHGYRFFTSVDELRRFVDDQLAGGGP